MKQLRWKHAEEPRQNRTERRYQFRTNRIDMDGGKMAGRFWREEKGR